MQASFTEIIRYILVEEGGFVNDPNDSGGPTNKGVTQNVYDSYRLEIGSAQRTVKEITDDELYEIYFNLYWASGACDKMCFPLNIVHMDSCVQHGVQRALEILQSVLNVEVDGLLGPHTKEAINLSCQSTDKAYLVAYRYILARVFYYDTLDEKHPERTKFLTNLWLKRMKHLYKEIDKLSSGVN